MTRQPPRGRAGKPWPWWLRPVSATAVVVAALLMWQVAQFYFADVHVSEKVERVLEERDEANVVVVLPFTPEQFHSVFFTDCCAIARVEGSRFYLQGVSDSDVRHIGEQYWVEKVALWDEPADK